METSSLRARTTRGMIHGLLLALLTIVLLGKQAIVETLGDHLRDNWLILRGVLLQDENDNSAVESSPNVALIEVDAATRERWNGRTFNARDVAQLVRLLKRNGVRAIALDLPDVNAAFVKPEERALLMRAMSESKIVHLPLPHYTASADFKRHFQEMKRVAAGVGHVTLWVDNDGHVRRVPLRVKENGKEHLSLALSCALQGLNVSNTTVKPLDVDGRSSSWNRAERVKIGTRIISVATGGLMMLNYAPTAPATPTAATAPIPSLGMVPDKSVGGKDSPVVRVTPQAPLFPRLSLQDALQNPRKMATWRGHCVVIGVSDRVITSQLLLSNGARVPEMMIHALALDSLLSDTTLNTSHPMTIWVMTVMLAICVGGIVASRPPLWSALVAFLSLLAVLMLSLGLFVQGLWFDVTLPCIAAGATFLQGVIWRARVEERETTRVAAAVETLERTGEIAAQRSQAADLLPHVLRWVLASSGGESASALLLQSEISANRVLDSASTNSAEGSASDEDMPASSFTSAPSSAAEQWHETATERQRKRGIDALSPSVRSAVFAYVQRTGSSVLIRDIRHDTRFWPRSRALISIESGLNIVSVMAAPLRVGGVLSGALLVVNGRDGTPFTSVDLQLLEAVSNQASVALDNARLYEILNRRIKRSESELELANRQLETEKNTLQAVLESMTDGVVVTDHEGNVQMVNPAARALLPELNDQKCSLAECLPDVASALASSMMAWEMASPPDEALTSTRPARDNTPERNTKSNGENALYASVLIERGDRDAPRLIEARSAPLQSLSQIDSKNEAQGLVAVFADVTQERAVQQAKSDFVSFVAHEMRSPLTSISGFSSMLQRAEKQRNESNPNPQNQDDTKITATRVRYLGVIHNESERLTRLINNLLDVARIEAGHALELQLQKIDFTQVAHDAIESQKLYSSRHTLRNEVPHDLPLIFADRDKVLQVLINLLSNASKYSPGGNITLSARVRENLLQGEHLEVCVRDEGPGIAPEHQARLFQRFGTLGTKGEAATNLGVGERAKPTGTGLGLFLTRYLVELHGGRIRVESQPGNGSTFIFTLPVRKS